MDLQTQLEETITKLQETETELSILRQQLLKQKDLHDETSDERSELEGSVSSAVSHTPNDIVNERLPDKSQSNTGNQRVVSPVPMLNHYPHHRICW